MYNCTSRAENMQDVLWIQVLSDALPLFKLFYNINNFLKLCIQLKHVYVTGKVYNQSLLTMPKIFRHCWQCLRGSVIVDNAWKIQALLTMTEGLMHLLSRLPDQHYRKIKPVPCLCYIALRCNVTQAQTRTFYSFHILLS